MLQAEKISKYYGKQPAISNFSFAAQAGEVVGLLGLNGAGKTTTLRILSGLLVPTAGKVLIDGTDLATEPEVARAKVGFLPETPPLYPDMTVDGFLRFVARINGIDHDVDAAVKKAEEAADIYPHRHQRIGTLSHGFQRRVGIAHAIVHDPKLILLDEPTGALDPVQIVHMRELIRSLRENRTIIVSSHILTEVDQMCDRIFVLHQGSKLAEGTPDELSRTVAQKVAVEVEVQANRDTLKKALADVDAVVGHRITKEINGVLESVIQLNEDCRPELAAALVHAGIGLLQMNRTDQGLEAVFLELTGGQPQGVNHA